MFVKKVNKNVSVSKVRFDEIMLYEFVKNIYKLVESKVKI